MWIYKELEKRLCRCLYILFLTAASFADVCIFSVPPPSLGIVSVPRNWRNIRWLSTTYIYRFYILHREKQGKLVELVFEEMKCLEEGPTLLGMMIDGNNILYRNVFIKELDAEVKVTTEEVFEAHIEEGSPEDDKFYCYVPAEEFFKLNDIDFEKYVNKNF